MPGDTLTPTSTPPEHVERLAYSVAQIVEATSLGRTVVFGLIASGELPSIVVGRRRLVLASALRQFLESHGAA